MNDLIPIEKVIEDNPHNEELKKQGYMVNPEKIDRYLELNQFKYMREIELKY